MATAVSDKIAPSIAVTTPIPGQSYSGTVHVTGTILDDALSAGDDKGTLKSIDYTVANDVLRRGRVVIAADGTATVDTSFGSGVITWTAATHGYAFDLDTVNPSVIHGLLTVTVDATDANDNVKSIVIQMSEGTGPVISITSPVGAALKYVPGTTVMTLSGTLANSSTDLARDNNITSLSWTVQGKTWGATIPTISPATTSYTVPNTGLFPVTNFTLDTTTRAFATSFTIPFISDQTLVLQLQATDANGHTTTSTSFLVANVSGPQIVLTSPITNLYYSSTAFTPTVITGVTDNTLQTMTLQLTTSGGYSSSVVTVYPTNGTGDTGSYGFNLGTGAFSFLMQGSGSTLLGQHGTATVTIKAVNSTATTTASYTITEDSSPPSIAAVAMASSNALPAYAKDGDTVTLTAQVSDSPAGLKAPPTVTIGGASSTVGVPVGSTFTAQHVMQPGDTVDGSGNVALSISATDNAGNTASATTVSSPASNVKFYDGPPTLSSVSIASNDPGRTTWARKSLDTVTVTFVSPRDLAGAPTVTIGAHAVAAVLTPSGQTAAPWTYTASTTLNASDTEGPVPFSIAFTDKAGNVGIPVTATTDSSQVVYDATAPSGYSVSVDQPYANAANKTAMSFTFAGAEVDTPTAATYSYTVSSSGGGTPVTGSGSITAASQQVTGVNVSTLPDGTLTLSVKLTDPAGNQGAAATATVAKDATPPSGYTVSINQAVINAANAAALGFTFAGAEVDSPTRATYAYTVSSSGGGTPVTGNGTITSATQVVSGVDVSSLPDGTLTLSVTLTDPAGNTGTAATATRTKDTTPPSGYTVSIDQPFVNNANKAAMSFTFAGAEVDSPTRATYAYTVSSSGGGTPVTGNGSITSATQQVTTVNVTGLGDGTLTLSVTLTDPAGNTGTAATATVTKDVVAPATTYTVPIDQPFIYSGNKTAMSFTFGGTAAETPATYNFTVTSSGGGTTVTGSGALSSPTQQVSGIDVSGLGDGTLTLTVKLTDPAGNQNTGVTATVAKDTTPPSGYTVSIDQGSFVNATTASAMSFHFAAATTGTTYNYSVSDGVNPAVTGTGSVTTTTQQVTGINVSGLNEGTLTLSVTLTDNHLNVGTAATATTTKDTIPPSISGVSMGAGNTSVAVTFSEGVYSSSNGTGALTKSAITVSDTTSGATATMGSGVTHTAGQATATFPISSWSPAPPTTGDQIVVTTVAAKIFDLAGNGNPGGTTGGDLAKVIRVFGSAATSAAAAVRSTISTFIGRSAPSSAADAPASTFTTFTTTAAGPEAPGDASGGTAAATRPVTQRPQFYQPIPAAAGTAAGQAPGLGGHAVPPAADQAAPQAAVAAASPPTTSTPVIGPQAAAPRTTSPGTAPSGTALAVHAGQTRLPSPGRIPWWWTALAALMAVAVGGAGAWGLLRFVRGRPR